MKASQETVSRGSADWKLKTSEIDELLSPRAVRTRSQRLFELAEKYGVSQDTKLVYDEVYSDFKVKKISSRFWPQTERVKTAIQLGMRSKKTDQIKFAKVADEAMRGVFQYMQTPKRGLWFDTLQNGKFSSTPAKASSLYHFTNAIAEYVQQRNLLQD